MRWLNDEYLSMVKSKLEFKLMKPLALSSLQSLIHTP